MTDSTQINQDPSGMIAWAISIGVHLGIGIVAFFITWSVIRTDDTPPPLITASWHEQPVIESAIPLALVEVAPEVEIQMPVLPDTPHPSDAIKDGIAVLNRVTSGTQLPVLARREPTTEVQFMGLDAVAAKRVIYVVDASGSMLLHLSSVVEELARSLRTLHPKQEFGIIFFQQDKSIVVPPKRELVSATASNIQKALDWINTSGKVVPTGSSNPITALKKAIRLKPDVMYLLSENITGSGRYEVPPKVLLEALDKLNPVNALNGRRRVQINCIEYLTQDPRHTMELIAEIHGGEDGYTLIERGKVRQ